MMKKLSFSMFRLKTPRRPSLATTLAHRIVALALVVCLLHAPQLLLAQVAGVSATQAGNPMALHIVILDGENALNNIRQRTAREPIVQVEDENHKPVSGVAVLFAVRRGKSGASGSFAGAATITVTTGVDGKAIASGLTPNTVQGGFIIDVTATLGATTTTAVIHQINAIGLLSTTSATTATSKAATITHHLLLTKHFWFVAGGVAAAGAVVATTVVLNTNSGATITTGTGTVKP